MTLLLLVIKYRLSVAYRQKIKLFGIKYEAHQGHKPASFSSLISYQLFPSALYSGFTQLLVITLKCLALCRNTIFPFFALVNIAFRLSFQN